jgi:hypothetical protein
MTDMQPFLPFSEIEYNPFDTNGTETDVPARASHYCARFLQEYCDPSTNTTDPQYTEQVESTWAQELTSSRRNPSVSLTPSARTWAEVRYSW